MQSAAAMEMAEGTALIAGIVGGVVALLLVIALIAFFMMRGRRQSNGDDAGAQQSAARPVSESEYGRIASTQCTLSYDDVDVVRAHLPEAL
jgi:hypothetical protein